MATQQTSLRTETIPNLVGGVSQLPDSIRPVNKAKEIINALLSLPEGLKRRPPTNYLQNLTSIFGGTFPEGGVFRHIYNRDLTERYILVVVNGDLKVFSLVDGVEKTVTFPDGKAYLDSDSPGTDFRAVTIGDYTFLVNRTVTVEKLVDLSPTALYDALVWVRTGDYGTTFSVTLDGTEYKFQCDSLNRDEVTTEFVAGALLSKIPNGKKIAKVSFGGVYAIGDTITLSEALGESDVYTVQAGADGSVETKHSIARNVARLINSGGLAQAGNVFAFPVAYDASFGLTDGIVISGFDSGDTYTWSVATSGAGTPSATNTSQANTYVATKTGSTIYLKRVDAADFTVVASDGLGDQSIRAIKGKVQRFSDLPARAVDGVTLEITGEEKSLDDNYYVVYSDSGTAGKDGVWRETLKGGEQTSLDPATMPWVLVRQADGTFIFEQADWSTRRVGDVANKGGFPSFVGSTISDVFFDRDRLGLASKENIILSASGDYFNFFRKSVIQVLDDDVIDISTGATSVANIRHCVPFENDMTLWADEVQFALQGEPLLTPKTVAAPTTTSFNNSQRTKPVQAGKDLFFATDRDGATQLMEYFKVLQSEKQYDADDVTAEVPSYCVGQPLCIAGGSNMQMVAVATQSDPEDLYVYNFLWNGDQNVQSAWSTWRFNNAEILSVDFLENRMVLIVQRGEVVTLELIEIIPDDADEYADGLTHLDCRMTNETFGVSVAFSGGITTWTLPFDFPIDEDFPLTVTRRATDESSDTSELEGVARPAAHKVSATGNYADTPVWIGLKYETDFEFSKLAVREQNIVVNDKTVVSYMELEYDKTGYFQVEVTPNNRSTPYTYTFDGDDNLQNGIFRVPVQCDNTTLEVHIKSKSPRPCAFQGVSWTAKVAQKTRRQ
jgi:hypothetical protein